MRNIYSCNSKTMILCIIKYLIIKGTRSHILTAIILHDKSTDTIGSEQYVQFIYLIYIKECSYNNKLTNKIMTSDVYNKYIQ